MKLAEAIFEGYRGYAKLSGRASRSEFWWFALFAVIVWVGIFMATFFIVQPQTTAPSSIELAREFHQFNATATLVAVPVIVIPLISVTIRRLHDSGRSAWWVLPVVGIQTFFGFQNTVLFLQPDITIERINEVNSSLQATSLSIALNILQVVVIIMAVMPSAPENRYGLPRTSEPNSDSIQDV